MADFFKMPQLGQSMEEGEIVKWYKQVGDSVAAGEPLLEIMSDKANIDVEAPVGGVLRKIMAEAGEIVPIHVPIAILGSADEPIDGLSADAAPTAGAPAVAVPDGPVAPAPSAPAPSVPVGDVVASPRARRVAGELGVDVAVLAGKGTGPDGRIVEADVQAYAAQAAAKPRVTPLAARVAQDLGVDTGVLGGPGDRVTSEDVRRAAVPAPVSAAPAAPVAPSGTPGILEVIPFKGLRRAAANTVAKSRQTAPHVTLNMEMDVTEAVALHAQLAPHILKSHETKLTITDVLIKAVARALADHPICNSALVGDEIQVYSDRNIGVAVATPTGLIVPVIKQADRKTLGDNSVELKALVERCRKGKATSDDLAGGTFTITNMGMFGVDSFDPILVPPQACILGVCRAVEKPLVVNGQIAIRSTMNLSLSFDHRVLDGVPAARFLQRVRELLLTPMLIFV